MKKPRRISVWLAVLMVITIFLVTSIEKATAQNEKDIIYDVIVLDRPAEITILTPGEDEIIRSSIKIYNVIFKITEPDALGLRQYVNISFIESPCLSNVNPEHPLLALMLNLTGNGMTDKFSYRWLISRDLRGMSGCIKVTAVPQDGGTESKGVSGHFRLARGPPPIPRSYQIYGGKR